MHKNLAYPDRSPGIVWWSMEELMVNGGADGQWRRWSDTNSPDGLSAVPPVVKAKHDGEGGSGQQDLVVIETMSRCHCKSISNLMEIKITRGTSLINFVSWEVGGGSRKYFLICT